MVLTQHQPNTRAPVDESADDLLARGNLLLQMLAQEAHAARLDAKRTELELAMSEAKLGKTERLAQWLRQYRAGQMKCQPQALASGEPLALAPGEPQLASGEPLALASGEPQALASGVLDAVATASGPEASAFGSHTASAPAASARGSLVNPWHVILPHARQRLHARAADLKSARGIAERKPSVDSQRAAISARSAPSRKEPTRSQHAAHPTDRPVDRAGRGQSAGGQTAVARLAKPTPLPSPNSSALARVRLLTEQFARPAPEIAETRFRAIRRTMASGMGVSMIFHAMVVILLMIITLKMPQPPASLALDASAIEPVTDTLEITQPSQPSDVSEDSQLEPSPMAPSPLVSTLPSLDNSALQSVTEQATDSQAKSLSSALAASSTSSAAAMIGKASASFFGAAARGNSFCYVVDSSGSMRGGAWEAAKGELIRSLASLSEKQRFYIIFFAEEFQAIPAIGQRDPSPYMLYANRENVDHARRWIDTIKIERGAPPNDALQFAISREPEAIYLLTDGVTKVDVCKFLRRVNRTDDFILGERVKIPIHAIAFYSLDGQQLLRQIAAENQGQFIYVPDPRTK